MAECCDGAVAARVRQTPGRPHGSRPGVVGVGDSQLGMAWVDRRLTPEGTQLLLYPARHLARSADARDVAALQRGDHLPLHESATVLERYPHLEDIPAAVSAWDLIAGNMAVSALLAGELAQVQPLDALGDDETERDRAQREGEGRRRCPRRPCWSRPGE